MILLRNKKWVGQTTTQWYFLTLRKPLSSSSIYCFVRFVLLGLQISVQCFFSSLFIIFVIFLLAVVLSVLRFTDSDYPFGCVLIILVLCQIQCVWKLFNDLINKILTISHTSDSTCLNSCLGFYTNMSQIAHVKLARLKTA